MTSAREGHATLRSSARTSRTNWAGDGTQLALALHHSLGLSVHRHGATLERKKKIGEGQGRRDSNPQPAVLETAALPIELLPSGVTATAYPFAVTGEQRR